jgi:hypothetical protein
VSIREFFGGFFCFASGCAIANSFWVTGSPRGGMVALSVLTAVCGAILLVLDDSDL